MQQALLKHHQTHTLLQKMIERLQVQVREELRVGLLCSSESGSCVFRRQWWAIPASSCRVGQIGIYIHCIWLYDRTFGDFPDQNICMVLAKPTWNTNVLAFWWGCFNLSGRVWIDMLACFVFGGGALIWVSENVDVLPFGKLLWFELVEMLTCLLFWGALIIVYGVKEHQASRIFRDVSYGHSERSI